MEGRLRPPTDQSEEPLKDGVDLARGWEDAPAIPRGGSPMRYKVGAEQLQQVPTLAHRPDTAFRAVFFCAVRSL